MSGRFHFALDLDTPFRPLHAAFFLSGVRVRYLVLLLLGLPVACSVAHAEVLVRQCDAPSGTTCSKWVWVQPSKAITVNTLRAAGGNVWAKLSDVLPVDRIATCYNDPAVIAGSSTMCSTRVPGRTDVWELKSVLYPAPTVGPLTVSWDAVTLDTNKTPMTVGGYIVHRQLDDCQPPTGPPCGSNPWIDQDVGKVTQIILEGLSGRWCFTVQAYSEAGDRGPLSDPAFCQTAQVAKQIPSQVTGVKVVAEPAQ